MSKYLMRSSVTVSPSYARVILYRSPYSLCRNIEDMSETLQQATLNIRCGGIAAQGRQCSGKPLYGHVGHAGWVGHLNDEEEHCLLLVHAIADNEDPSVPQQGGAPWDHCPDLCMILQVHVKSLHEPKAVPEQP